ncbi:response regulator [Acetobacter orleanensis]|uniref:histidine kinase n=1 Tax=Acetobacter orleanensis TaxID=104099 RepID=A0A4Y3TJ86_9PROT|nr:response regulator [Acetobacter orleanensis]KXV62104.1 histidine kinase [Acetobacter orleanensis]PCD80446.1 hybrid sensor histidine kinase/response regulator [Acetobacter orleanensis]GAN67484.1 two component hybrid sensor histidine kinase and transcriptional regulator [Acetobacter orleanensis JCM 7639]GBR26475.1 two component hybrid sensor histidine kinase and regulator [Acetobacter orleanensis NRIC 0473]GEB81803.1 hybrid sensor histidine kinase/response regulator [Acetobacter orleanensis]
MLPEPNKRSVVLVVDDEPEILVALTDLLEETYDVLSASSGERGLALLQDHADVAVIVSDQRMPGMTGDVFLARARDISAAGAILLTGYADIAAVEAALNQGQISFFAYKPWDDETLLSMVAQAASRYHLERELQCEQLLLRGLLDNLPFGLGFKEQSGRFIRLNNQMAEQFGRSVEACIGHTEEELVDTTRLESLKEAQSALDSSGRDQQVLQIKGQDGQARWHDLTRVRLDGAPGGAVSGCVSGLENYSILIDRDVTDLLAMEQRLRQAEKMQAIGTLAGGIAHDFNNLLTAILGSLELVMDLEPPKDPGVSRLFHNALEAARRGGALTQKLLDFSRPRHLVCQQVDLRSLMASLQSFMSQGKVPDEIQAVLGAPPVTPSSRISTVQFDIPQTSLPVVWTDATQLELAVFNLCVNALDAQPEGGATTVSVRQAVRPLGLAGNAAHGDVWVVVQVMDRGVGMTEEIQARIFDPFFTTKGIGQGTGLGLSMIYGFISHCGGEVRVESVPGGGTSIELWLPAMAEDRATVASITPVKTMPIAPPPKLQPVEHGETILVVDDEPGVRAVTAGFLRRAGYNVLESASGAEALSVIAEKPEIALVVMDVMMPGMNGDEVARRLHTVRPELPVLFVTGYADFAMLPEGVTVLHKPYTRDALLGDVRALLVA